MKLFHFKNNVFVFLFAENILLASKRRDAKKKLETFIRKTKTTKGKTGLMVEVHKILLNKFTSDYF